MDYNVQNGGLTLKVGDKLFISDINRFATTYIMDPHSKTIQTEGVFWFMNHHEDCVYYSDQKQRNVLCRMDLQRYRVEVVLDKPCYGLYVEEESIYYISENDRKLYRCALNGNNESKIIDEQVENFLIEDTHIFYATPQGIRLCNENGNEREMVSDAVTSAMILTGNKLAYVDKHNQYTVTLLDLETNSTEAFDGIAAFSLNTDGRYLYCANRLNAGSIYRIDPESGSSIRICGESADYLHILDQDMYFCKNREWHQMSLSGGQAVKLLL